MSTESFLDSDFNTDAVCLYKSDQPFDNQSLLVYVCLVNEVNLNQVSRATSRHEKNLSLHLMDVEEQEWDHDEVKIERNNGIHDIRNLDLSKNTKEKETSDNDYSSNCEEYSQIETAIVKTPKVLKLTQMKWLTDGHDGAPNSSISPWNSLSSISSQESTDNIQNKSMSNRYLSTIMALDKEHNMFGLSNLDISLDAPSMPFKKKKDSKPVFHQTAIVQICTTCPGCKKCCGPPAACIPDPTCCPTGFQLSVSRKLDYKPTPVEISPRACCELGKPLIARPCAHLPRCCPPSCDFPYLMPCYWPAREGAPCPNPERCFHNPPCAPPKPKYKIKYLRKCPQHCGAAHVKSACPNEYCLAKNPAFKKAFEDCAKGKNGKKEKK